MSEEEAKKLVDTIKQEEFPYALAIAKAYEKLEEENKELKEQINIMSEAFDELEHQKQDYTQINILEMKLEKENNILTEFEKWLENEAKRKKTLQEQFFEPKNKQGIIFEKLNSQVAFIDSCLDKLQELKEGNK